MWDFDMHQMPGYRPLELWFLEWFEPVLSVVLPWYYWVHGIWFRADAAAFAGLAVLRDLIVYLLVVVFPGVLVGAIIGFVLQRLYVYWERWAGISHIPQPPSASVLLGHAADLSRKPIHLYIADLHKKYGDVFRLRLLQEHVCPHPLMTPSLSLRKGSSGVFWGNVQFRP
jgi:hypothetical protein